MESLLQSVGRRKEPRAKHERPSGLGMSEIFTGGVCVRV